MHLDRRAERPPRSAIAPRATLVAEPDVVVSGGSTCPTGTTPLYAGSDVVFRNPNNGNLTEDARCWQTAPSPTTEVGVAVVGPCVVCRLAP